MPVVSLQNVWEKYDHTGHPTNPSKGSGRKDLSRKYKYHTSINAFPGPIWDMTQLNNRKGVAPKGVFSSYKQSCSSSSKLHKPGVGDV